MSTDPLSILLEILNDDPSLLKNILSLLGSTEIELVMCTLKFINSLMVTPAFTSDDQALGTYFLLRKADLWRNLELVVDKAVVATACKDQLVDLQSLLMIAIQKSKRLNRNTAIGICGSIYEELSHDLKNLFSAVEEPGAGMNPNEDREHDYVMTAIDCPTTPSQGGIGGIHPSERSELLTSSTKQNQDSTIINSKSRWAGMFDLYDYFRCDRRTLSKRFAEQAAFVPDRFKFPLVKSALAISEILYDIFEIEKCRLPPTVGSGTARSLQKNSLKSSSNLMVDDLSHVCGNLDAVSEFKPLFFYWTTLQFWGVSKFMRIWEASKASDEDLDNIVNLMRVLFERALKVERIDVTTMGSIQNVVTFVNRTSYDEMRQIQLENIELEIDHHWSEAIAQLRNHYYQEAQEFVRQQRLRLLLRGDWFFVDDPIVSALVSVASSRNTTNKPTPIRRYFIALAPGRQKLLYGIFNEKPQNSCDHKPNLLEKWVDLSEVRPVLTPIQTLSPMQPTAQLKRVSLSGRIKYTRISLVDTRTDVSTFDFYSDTADKTATWRDGLEMATDSNYQSEFTRTHVAMLAETKLKLQMSNLAPDDHKAVIATTGVHYDDRENVSTNFYYR
jgi:hypothetical protein